MMGQLLSNAGGRRPWTERFFHRGVSSALLFLSGLAGLAAACQPSVEPSVATDLPEALVERWVEMWNSYDLDEVQELFFDSPALTYFSSEKEGVIRGMDAVLEHHRGFGFLPGGEDKPSRLWLEGVETDLFGDLAVITGLWFFQSDEDSFEDPQKGPVTFVAVQSSGTWRFVHMNFSEYLPQDSL